METIEIEYLHTLFLLLSPLAGEIIWMETGSASQKAVRLFFSPLAGEIIWMETLLRLYIWLTVVYSTPHSLGKLFEWKLKVAITVPSSTHIISPLAGEIIWMETNLVIPHPLHQGRFSPLAGEIIWMETKEELYTYLHNIGASPLAGEIIWMETSVRLQAVASTANSPLAGEIIWMETVYTCLWYLFLLL